MKRLLFFLLLVVSTSSVLSQQVYSTHPAEATVFPTDHKAFEGYAFVLNGKIIEQHDLVNFPGAMLNNVYAYATKLEGRNYAGAVYFHTHERYAPRIIRTKDPAYFVNGRQVSPDHFRLTTVEAYNRIQTSKKDTLIDGTVYPGSIRVDTEEDFFAQRIALPELIEKRTGLSAEHVIVHWRGPRGPDFRYYGEEDIGTIISDHFPIYYFDVSDDGLRAIEADRIRFAEGERYVVHLVDNQYKRTSPKGRLIFENPLAADTVFPCYVTDFDHAAHNVYPNTEIAAEPHQGKDAYRRRLSDAMGLPAEQPEGTMTPDSITVQFFVLRDGLLAALESTDRDTAEKESILNAIKKLACAWRPALMSGRPVVTKRKITIFYSKDRKGKVRSLDNLVYRYDNR